MDDKGAAAGEDSSEDENLELLGTIVDALQHLKSRIDELERQASAHEFMFTLLIIALGQSIAVRQHLELIKNKLSSDKLDKEIKTVLSDVIDRQIAMLPSGPKPESAQ